MKFIWIEMLNMSFLRIIFVSFSKGVMKTEYISLIVIIYNE
ncbi:hypothetical protein M099_2795 [Phocaeicola vulgatus str. 3975 RP4]|uniref:Uncharacterized protein n=1 Tax=Phocaeicola vulgatus str. 3975 RP4 TaxID=1339352 RepID=A0A069SFI8_PHOVU|nr:hypothetical protein M099_2795 [Phocaeicola vulgatus str. 3975 RP4]